jgi:serine/threonine protein kinase/tetratricopeptide (TPR) repeat protein
MADKAAAPATGAADTPRATGPTPPPGALEGADIRATLAGGADLTANQVADLVLADQMARWKRGERVPVEAYLHLHPALDVRGADAFDVVFNEFLLRQEQGEAPAADEYLWRFPQFADRFRQQLSFDRDFSLPDQRVSCSASSQIGLGSVPHRNDWPDVAGYDLLGELGRGGMGVVYRARQHDLNRQVALKLILSAGPPGDPDADRFRHEAETAARLQHPNIVQIHAVGEHEGRPYLALELVEGTTLAQQLAGQPLPPPQAAHLVAVLAAAMQHAHERGIVHRDLKPANVLLSAACDVTACGFAFAAHSSECAPNAKAAHPEGVPANAKPQALVVPKITDFGLAKRLDQSGTQTQTGVIVGTPSYMAPEQAAGRARDVGPTADVYALGAILYECLTGRPPFKADTPLNTLQQVLGQDPVPLRRLQPTVPRDLETICLKCLHKEPHRRYASAGALADDLRRFQAGQPISARPVGPWERGWKWARRHPAGAALVGVIAAALVGFVAGGLKYVADQREALHQKDVEQARAEENLALAHKTLARTLERIGNYDQVEVPEIREVREALLGDVEELVRGLMGSEDSPNPQTRYYHAFSILALAELQDRDRRLRDAEKNYAAGLAHLERLAREFPNVAQYGHDLARFRFSLGQMYKRQGRAEDAITTFRQVAEYWNSVPDTDPNRWPRLALVYNSLGETGPQQAEHYYQKAIALGKDLLAERPRDRDAAHNLGMACYNRGKYYLEHGRRSEALADMEEARKLFEGLPRDRRGYRLFAPSLIEVYKGLGAYHGTPGRAEEFYKKAVELAEKMGGLFPGVFGLQDRLATSRYQLASVYIIMGRGKEAEPLLDKVVAFYDDQSRDSSQGPEPWYRLAQSLDILGLVQGQTKSPKQAEDTHRKAVAVAQTATSRFPDDLMCVSVLATSCGNLARFYFNVDRLQEGVKLCDLAIAALTPAFRKDSRNVTLKGDLYKIYTNRALGHYHLGRMKEAMSDLDQAWKLLVDPDRVRFTNLSVLLRTGAGQHARAVAEAKSLASLRQIAPGDLDELYKLATACAQILEEMMGKSENGKSVPDLYEDAALALLSRLRSVGYFKDAARRRRLTEDSSLAPLRKRPAFQEWLRQTDK